MWTDYVVSIIVDTGSVLGCILLLLRFARLRFSHPAVPYLFCHLNTVSFRLFSLAGGARPLFSGTRVFAPVEASEIVRAALCFDVALWIVTLVWVFSDNDFEERPATDDELLLDPKILKFFVPIFLAAGAMGMRLLAIPGASSYEGLNESEWRTNSYVYITPTWFGLALIAHMYYYGANKVTSLLMAGYLGIIAIQGGLRFRIIVACLMLVHIWVERRQRRWPSLAIFAGLTFLAIAFFPMKEIGLKLQDGASLDDLSDTVTSSVTEVLDGRAADQAFLDQCASVMTLCDQRGEHAYGRGYIPLLTLVIPRVWWPDKPSLADASYVKFVSTNRRPMNKCGMIGTYIGEAYVDFGLPGLLLAPLVLAFGLSWFARHALRSSFYSVKRFAFAIVSVNFIQIFRDGFIALFMFTFVNMMPLVLLVLVHVGLRFLRSRRAHAEALVPGGPETQAF